MRKKGRINEHINTAYGRTDCKQLSFQQTLKPSPQTVKSPTSSLPAQRHPGKAVRARHTPPPQLPYSQSCRRAAQPPPTGAEAISYMLAGRMSPLKPCSAWERSPGCSKSFRNKIRVSCTFVPCCLSRRDVTDASPLAAGPSEMGLRNVSFWLLRHTHARLPGTSRTARHS